MAIYVFISPAAPSLVHSLQFMQIYVRPNGVVALVLVALSWHHPRNPILVATPPPTLTTSVDSHLKMCLSAIRCFVSALLVFGF